jgi:hypothetical protein
MTTIPCPGTRQPVLKRRLSGRLTGYSGRYGEGLCAVCGKLVTCHKDGSAVYHKRTTT